MAVEIGWATTERRFTAMGTTGHVVVVGPSGRRLADRAIERIAHLEQLWTRFDRDSELARLGHNGGRPMTVSDETYALIERSILAWRVTGGRFDPTMADQLSDLGYNRTFAELHSGRQATTGPSGPRPYCDGPPDPLVVRPACRQPAAGCDGIVLDRDTSTVQLPADVRIDPGGMGKGLAADLVSAELMNDGAWGVLVGLGGDLRVRGVPPVGEAWTVDIIEPTIGPKAMATVRLVDCGLATSTTRRRRWAADGRQHHHVLDPTTGCSTIGGVDLVSVIAGDGWWAEAAATAVIGGAETPSGCAAMRVLADGTVERHGQFKRYER